MFLSKKSKSSARPGIPMPFGVVTETPAKRNEEKKAEEGVIRKAPVRKPKGTPKPEVEKNEDNEVKNEE